MDRDIGKKDFFFSLFWILLLVSIANLVAAAVTGGFHFRWGILEISSGRPERLLPPILLIGLLANFFRRGRGFPDAKASEPVSARDFHLYPVALIASVSLLVFARNLPSFFLSDDFDYLALFRSSPLLSPSKLSLAFRSMGLFRPAGLLSLNLDQLVWGLRPFGYHLTSLLLHAGCGVLLYSILLRLRAGRRLALTAALVFSAYPLHWESVGWISGRFDVLCAFLYLLSLYFYLAFRSSRRARDLAMSMLAFAGALLSKEMALTLPLIIVLGECAARGVSQVLRRWRDWSPYLLLTIAYFGLRFWLIGAQVSYAHAAGLSWRSNLYNIVVRPFRPLFLPLNGGAVPHARAWEAGLLLGFALLILAFARGQSSRLVPAALAFIPVSLLPTFGVFQVDGVLEGSRFLYLPSAGAAVLIAGMLDSARKERPRAARSAGTSSAVLLISAFAVVSLYNGIPWKRASVLARDMTAKFSEAARATAAATEVSVRGLPDGVDGAFVFRNGFTAAVRMFGPNDRLDVRVVGIDSTRDNRPVLVWTGNGFATE